MLGKEFLFVVVRELFLSSSFMGAGTFGFFLFTIASKREEMLSNVVEEGNVITNFKSKGTWTFEREYEDGRFVLGCRGNGPNTDLNDSCVRKIRSKVSEDKVIDIDKSIPQWRVQGQETYEMYKFTYSGKERLEDEDNKIYYGWCDPNEIESGKDNICSSEHLPDVWKKEKVITTKET